MAPHTSGKEADCGSKRSCSSLDRDNTCSGCGMTFNAPHLLKKHERSSCRETSSQLDQLRKQAELLAHPTAHAIKRRRVDAQGHSQAEYSQARSAAPPHAGRGMSDPSPQRRRGVSTQAKVNSGGKRPSGNPLTQEPKAGFQTSSGSGVPQRTKDSARHDRNGSPSEMTACGSQSSSRASAQSVPAHSALEATSRQPAPDTAGLGDAEPNANPVPAPKTPSSSPEIIINSFHLRKKYPDGQPPANDPDQLVSSYDRYDSLNHLEQPEEYAEDSEVAKGSKGSEELNASNVKGKAPSYAPFPNRSSFELGEWFYGQGTQKSLKDFHELVKVLTDPTFSLNDIKDTKWTGVFQDLGKNKDDIHPSRSEWVDDSGWKTTDVEIEVPIHSRMEKGHGVEMRVAGTLHHRSIVSILEEKIRNAHASKFFHLDGHELLWQPGPSDHSPEFRVTSELYNSDAFLQAQRDLRENPPPEIGTCKLQRVVVGAMLWSDATHLSTFSNAKLWPLYMLFGNESKYQRGKDASDFCYHVAYFDTLSDSFKDYITERTGGKVPPNLAAYLNREFFHAQWVIILDDELLKAIVEGIVIKCSDGVERRFFIRIFTYSADYPEKVLIATIKSRSDCPCVRCLTPKKNLSQMGTAEDLAFRKANPRLDTASRQQGVINARDAIAGGLAVGGEKVLSYLTHSGVPTIASFNIFSALVADLLHEFEIGVFKALFLHLIRILDALSSGSVLVHELDKRYRAIPTFNQTIRRFSSNVSQLRRRAARDYEDILQCAIPAFHGLLPEALGKLVLQLLYMNARWHALAKLRMQTEATIVLLEDATSQLGDLFRRFIQAVDKINTVETASEAGKRARSQKKKENQKKETPKETKKKETKKTTQKDARSLESRKDDDKTKTTTPPGAASSVLGVPGSAHASADAPTPANTSQPAQQAGTYDASPSTTVPRPPLPRVRLIVRPPGQSASEPAQSGSGKRVNLIVRPTPSVTQPSQSSLITHPPAVNPSSSTAGSADNVGSLVSERVLSEGAVPPVVGCSGQTVDSQLSSASTVAEPQPAAKKGGRRPRKMNIATIKFHALGHYPSTVRFFGPSDLYSTEWGENFHRSPKAWFKLTSKRQIRKELSTHERKRARLKKARQRLLSAPQSLKAKDLKNQRAAARDPNIHHYIGPSKQSPIHLIEFAKNETLSNDVACSLLVPNLKRYLFRRFLCDGGDDLTDEDLEDLHQIYDWSKVFLKNDCIYTHRIMRIKYTTYDTRRDEDIIHIETDQSNVMLLNPAYSYGSPLHPFTYGKVIAILHADVGFVGDIGRRGSEYFYRPIEFLWVRWYRSRPNGSASGEFALDEAELIPIDEPGSHSFINPKDVIRACHILPNFAEGKRYTDGIGKSATANDRLDYKSYFINRFVDRDMFMRYEWGLAVGHTYTHSSATEANKKVLDAHKLKASPTSTTDAAEVTAVVNVGDSTPSSAQPCDVGETRVDSGITSQALNLAEDEQEADDEDEDEERRGWSDGEYDRNDEEDYISDPERDSEDEKIVEMFGDELGF